MLRDMLLALTCFSCIPTILIIPVASGTLISTPQNLVAMSGQEVKMHCQTDNGKKLKWYSQRPGSSKEDQDLIYTGYGFSKHAASVYEITTSSDGDCNLSFNASVETAQRYTCMEPGSLETKSAELIVLGSDPSCEINLDDGYANISCTIVFNGNWTPVVEWTWCHNETIITSYISTAPNDCVSSTLRVRRNGNNRESCYRLATMFRETGRPQETNADNTPTYSHTTFFRHTDWNDTSDRSEFRKDNSTAHSYSDKESDSTIMMAIGVACALLFIAMVGGVSFYCCYSCKNRDADYSNISGNPKPRKKTSPN